MIEEELSYILETSFLLLTIATLVLSIVVVSVIILTLISTAITIHGEITMMLLFIISVLVAFQISEI
jgi:hypothetical protein